LKRFGGFRRIKAFHGFSTFGRLLVAQALYRF